MPVAYIPRTRELYSDFKPYQWVINETRAVDATSQAHRAIENRADEFRRDHVSRPASLSS